LKEIIMAIWQRLIAYVGESDQWKGKPVYMALVEEAKKHGIAGATAIRGIEGFGVRDSGRIHTSRILELSSELPILVLMIDSQEALDRFLPVVKEIVPKGLVTLETLNVVHPAPPSNTKSDS
jgi:PII-like signaling protein